AGGAGAVDIAAVIVVVEEQLGNGTTGACVELALEGVDLGLPGGAPGGHFGVGGDRNVGVAAAADAGDQLGGTAVALGMRNERRGDALGRIAAQGDDARDAGTPVTVDDGVAVVPRGADAGEVGRRIDPGLGLDAAHHAQR